MMVIIVPAAVNQSEAGGVRAGHTVSFSLAAQAEQLRCSFPRPLLLHYNSTIPSPSNSTRNPTVLSRLLYALLHFIFRICAPCPFPPSPSHHYCHIHTEPTPCRGPSKISSSTTMRKRHALSVLKSLTFQIEAFGPASVVIRFVLTAHSAMLSPANKPSQICQFCYHNVRNNMNGLCPACRRPYDDANIEFRKPGPEEYPFLPARSPCPSLTSILGKPSGEPNKPPSKRSSLPPPKRKHRSARPIPSPASILLACASCKRTWSM